MAGKKGQVVQLQLEVNTEEEWEKLLEKDGLVVVDIYSEWCGPCLGMVGTLKKIKLEIGGDFLTFAIAKSDGIEALARFRNRSEPTWMFIANGQLVNLIFGADAPRLTNLIINEIAKEKQVLSGDANRNSMPFDELTPEEYERQKEKEKIRMAARVQEEALEANLKAAEHHKEIRNLIKYIESYTVILLMPYLFEDGIGEAWQTLMEELGTLGFTVQDEEKFELEPRLASELIYGGMQEISDEFNEQLEAGLSVAKLMLYKPPDAEDIEPPPEEEEVEIEEDVEVLAAETDAIFGAVNAIYGTRPPEAEGQTLDMKPDSLEASYRKSPTVPAFWTPVTPTGKANAIMKLFPKFAEKYKLPPPPTLPPVIAIVFDATKSAEVNEMMHNYEDEVLATGYFTGSDPSTAKKLAVNQNQYDQRQFKREGEILVIVVNRKRSEPLLSFCQLGPLYISDSTDDGKKDYEAFFPDEEEEEEEFEPDVEPEQASKVSTVKTYLEEEQPGDQVSEYSYEKEEKFVQEYDEISGLSTLGEIPPLEVGQPNVEEQPEQEETSEQPVPAEVAAQDEAKENPTEETPN